MKKRLRTRYAAVTGVLVLALAGAALAGVVAHANAGTKAVRVTVVEKEYSLTLKRTLASGLTTFIVENKGKVGHSLELSGPGLKAKRIVGLVGPGKTRLLTVTLKGGTYRFWCPVPGHASLGMKATVRVGATTTSAQTSTAATTTGRSSGWG
jgi:plastocyanin